MSAKLKAPFPWFGGKSAVADLVWERFGDVPNYVEPFFGSGAVLLARPHPPRIETINDLDCYVANFWRAVQYDPEGVALWADWPVNEADLHARHLWLVNQDEFRERMKTDPDYYDIRIAGWWVWGISCWIGSGWCSKPEWSGRISACRAERGIHSQDNRRPSNGVHRAGFEKTRPNLQPQGVHRATNDGTPRPAANPSGVHRRNHGNDPETNKRRPHITSNQGVHKTTLQKRPRISGFSNAGVHKKGLVATVPDKRPSMNRGGKGVANDIGDSRSAAGRGIHASARTVALMEWMSLLADRLRCVRICCGDWTRILGRSPTECIGVTGIFLDPPYGAERDSGIYSHDDMLLSTAVRRYAIAHGRNKKLRIALCGYEGEHEMPKGWTCLAWKANGGHGNAAQGRGRANASRERIWFSPHCLAPSEPELFQTV